MNKANSRLNILPTKSGQVRFLMILEREHDDQKSQKDGSVRQVRERFSQTRKCQNQEGNQVHQDKRTLNREENASRREQTYGCLARVNERSTCKPRRLLKENCRAVKGPRQPKRRQQIT